MAIILSVAAGINARSHRNYRQVLKSCLDICAEIKDMQKTTQLNFYEFYILVRHLVGGTCLFNLTIPLHLFVN